MFEQKKKIIEEIKKYLELDDNKKIYTLKFVGHS